MMGERVVDGLLGVLFGLVVGFGLTLMIVSSDQPTDKPEPEIIVEHDVVRIPVPHIITETITETVLMEVERLPEVELTQAEKELIAQVLYVEVPYEDEIGKRLVVDVILNRVRSPHFPNSVYGVVYQKSQFAHAATYSEACMAAVEAELYGQLDYDVGWFCSDGWIGYGQKAYQHGGHWFNWFPEKWIKEAGNERTRSIKSGQAVLKAAGAGADL